MGDCLLKHRATKFFEGDFWVPFWTVPPGDYTYAGDIGVDPNTGYLYVVSNKKVGTTWYVEIHRSTNNGQSWTVVNSQVVNFTDGAQMGTIAFIFNKIIVICGKYLFYSVDGISWTLSMQSDHMHRYDYSPEQNIAVFGGYSVSNGYGCIFTTIDGINYTKYVTNVYSPKGVGARGVLWDKVSQQWFVTIGPSVLRSPTPGSAWTVYTYPGTYSVCWDMCSFQNRVYINTQDACLQYSDGVFTPYYVPFTAPTGSDFGPSTWFCTLTTSGKKLAATYVSPVDGVFLMGGKNLEAMWGNYIQITADRTKPIYSVKWDNVHKQFFAIGSTNNIWVSTRRR